MGPEAPSEMWVEFWEAADFIEGTKVSGVNRVNVLCAEDEAPVLRIGYEWMGMGPYDAASG